MQQHEARLVYLRRTVRQHPANTLAVGQAAAERAAANDMLGRHVQRALRHCNIVHAVAEPAIGKTMLSHIEALASSAEYVLAGDPKILDVDF